MIMIMFATASGITVKLLVKWKLETFHRDWQVRIRVRPGPGSRKYEIVKNSRLVKATIARTGNSEEVQVLLSFKFGAGEPRR